MYLEVFLAGKMEPFYIPGYLISDNIQLQYNGHVSESDALKITSFSAAEFHGAILYLVSSSMTGLKFSIFYWLYWPHPADVRPSVSHLRHARLQEESTTTVRQYTYSNTRRR